MTDNHLPIPAQLLGGRHDPPEINLLLQECASGKLGKVREIFQSYLIRVAREERNLRKFATVLLTAAGKGRPDILSYMLPYWLSAGCPFLPHSLVWGGIAAKSVAVLEVLLDFGWDINEPMSRIAPPALYLASKDWDLTNWFFDHGADPNARTWMDSTPFSFVIEHAPLHIIHLFFQRGGSVEKGQLIHHAVLRKSDEIEVVDLLLQKGASLNTIMYSNDPESYYQWVLFGIGTPLHVAVHRGQVKLVSHLLDKGADPSIKDTRDRTPLYCAKNHNRTDGRIEIIRLLEKAGGAVSTSA